MSISHNYYLRRAFELEKLARRSSSLAMQTSLQDLALAFRTLANNETLRRDSILRAADLEVDAMNLMSGAAGIRANEV